MPEAYSSPYDGQRVTYFFGPEHRGDAWRTTASSLGAAVRAFRAAVLYPEKYQDPDATVRVAVVVRNGHSRESRELTKIPVVGDEIDRATIGLMLTAADPMGISESTALAAPRDAISVRSATRLELRAQTEAINAKKAELERLRTELNAQMATLEAELRHRTDQLWLIELFLGTKERVVQIREGAPAAAHEKITIRQRVLCMDEEIAVHEWLQDPSREPEQFTADRLRDFDRWLAETPGAVDAVFPWPKGVMALRARRRPREYDAPATDVAEAYERAENAARDHMTYLLIRNGAQLYRVWVDVNIWPQFIPTAEREKPFVSLVMRMEHADLDDDAERARCERLVRWWKMKTKEHRALGDDEPKALRMVRMAFRDGKDFDNDPERLLFGKSLRSDAQSHRRQE